MSCFPPDPVTRLGLEAANEGLLVYAEVQEALRGVPVDRPVAFDLDDTVATGGTRTERLPEDVLATRHAIAWVLGRLLEEGRRILIVTGRDDAVLAWKDLGRALDEVCSAPLEGGLLERITMSCGGEWMGTKIAVERKVRALREHRAALLVGDLDHLDGRAARRAGIPFIDVGPHHTARRLGA